MPLRYKLKYLLSMNKIFRKSQGGSIILKLKRICFCSYPNLEMKLKKEIGLGYWIFHDGSNLWSLKLAPATEDNFPRGTEPFLWMGRFCRKNEVEFEVVVEYQTDGGSGISLPVDWRHVRLRTKQRNRAEKTS